MNSITHIYNGLIVVVDMLALLMSCQYNKTDPPQERTLRPPWERTMTIQELRALYQFKLVWVVPDAVIAGQVTSDDSEGNIYKSVYLQDGTGGIGFKAGLVNSDPLYKRGSKIAIRYHGLTLGKYGGVVTLGKHSTEPKYENAYLPEQATPSLVRCDSSRQPFVYHTLAILTLSPEYTNTLMRLEGVQFVDSELDQTYADADNKTSVPAVERQIEDQQGNRVVPRSSSYTLFAGRQIPQDSGNVTAIPDYFNGKPQLLISLGSDINFISPRFQTTK